VTPESEALLTAAESKLKAAELLLNAGMNGDAVSRAYYAVFHAISALHLASGNSYSSHAQLIGRFNKDFVRTGVFAPALSRVVTRLFEDRQLGDYDATAEFPLDQATQDITDAHQLVQAIRTHLKLN
jgi:uncharacterized protein (UPF0332 family)